MNEIIQVAADGSVSATGSVATRLMSSGMSTASLRTNELLRRDEWKQFDDRVIESARTQLRGVADLFSAGLTYGISNPLGKTRIEWEQVTDMDGAEVSMSGVTPGQTDRVTFHNQNLPLPIIHKDFNLNIRNLAASRERGDSLDTIQAEICTRKVAEEMEKLLFKGYGSDINGSKIHGYLNAPHRKLLVPTGGQWTTREPQSSDPNANRGVGTVAGAKVIGQILQAIDLLTASDNNMFGPYVLYTSLPYYNVLQDDYKPNSDKTILQRLLEIDQITSVRATTYVPLHQVLLIQMTRDVVDWVDGMQPSLLQWDTQGGMVSNFKVMAIGVPRMKFAIKDDPSDTQSGVCHITIPA